MRKFPITCVNNFFFNNYFERISAVKVYSNMPWVLEMNQMIIFFKMALLAAKIRGHKVIIRKDQLKIYKDAKYSIFHKTCYQMTELITIIIERFQNKKHYISKPHLNRHNSKTKSSTPVKYTTNNKIISNPTHSYIESTELSLILVNYLISRN